MFLKSYKNIFASVALLFLCSTSVYASESFWSWLFSVSRKNEVENSSNPVYQKECGACHFAYPPGLLPSGSWSKLMTSKSLSDHFGDTAELDENTRQALETFLVENAAEKSHYKRSKKIAVSIGGDDPPLRITEVTFIKRKHHELEDKHVKNNPQVKSLSQCDKCHREADESIFDDDTVDIPNFGRWTW